MKNISLFLLILTLLTTVMLPVARAQVNNWPDDLCCYTLESIGRSWATTTILPKYPEEALQKGVEGVVEVRIGINDAGQVGKIKVSPTINPLFRKAVVSAVKQWQFRLRTVLIGEGKYDTFRLTFHFFLENGEGHVMLVPVNSKAGKRVREASRESVTEWKQWVDVTDEN